MMMSVCQAALWVGVAVQGAEKASKENQNGTRYTEADSWQPGMALESRMETGGRG